MTNSLSLLELFLLASVSHSSSIIYSTLNIQNELFEFILCVIPLYFSIIYIQNINYISAGIAGFATILVITMQISKIFNVKKKSENSDKEFISNEINDKTILEKNDQIEINPIESSKVDIPKKEYFSSVKEVLNEEIISDKNTDNQFEENDNINGETILNQNSTNGSKNNEKNLPQNSKNNENNLTQNSENEENISNQNSENNLTQNSENEENISNQNSENEEKSLIQNSANDSKNNENNLLQNSTNENEENISNQNSTIEENILIIQNKEILETPLNSQNNKYCEGIQQNLDKNNLQTSSIDHCFALGLICIIISIFAADFKIFNSAKAGLSSKEELRLMDVGLGLFTVGFGFISINLSKKRLAINAIICLIVGLARFYLTDILSYKQFDFEFGKYLNYFFILAVLNIIAMLKIPYEFAFGLLLCILHELILLQFGLKEMIMENKRTGNFIMKNLEGISFLIPESGVFMMSRMLAVETKSKLPRTKQILFGAFSLFGFGLIATNSYFPPCRRIHNLTYIMTIMSIATTNGILFSILNILGLLKKFELKSFINQNKIILFIIGNAFIVVAQELGLREVENVYLIHLINISYLFITIYCSYLLNKLRKIYFE